MYVEIHSYLCNFVFWEGQAASTWVRSSLLGWSLRGWCSSLLLSKIQVSIATVPTTGDYIFRKIMWCWYSHTIRHLSERHLASTEYTQSLLGHQNKVHNKHVQLADAAFTSSSKCSLTKGGRMAPRVARVPGVEAGGASGGAAAVSARERASASHAGARAAVHARRMPHCARAYVTGSYKQRRRSGRDTLDTEPRASDDNSELRRSTPYNARSVESAHTLAAARKYSCAGSPAAARKETLLSHLRSVLNKNRQTVVETKTC